MILRNLQVNINIYIHVNINSTLAIPGGLHLLVPDY